MEAKLFNDRPFNTPIITDMVGKSFKFISSAENQPIQVILNTDKLYSVTFPVNYPLFSVILHLKKLYDDDHFNLDTIDTVIESWTNQFDKLLDEALANFKKSNNITIKKTSEAENFINALELIRELTNDIFNKKIPEKIEKLTLNNQNSSKDKEKLTHQFIEKLTQGYRISILNFILNFKKSLIIKNKKRALDEAINDFILDSSIAVAFAYFIRGYFHQAEIHLKNASNFLEKIKDQERTHQHSFPLKLLSAKTYFEFGYYETTLNLIRESQKLVKNKFIADFDGTLFELIKFIKSQFLPFYQDKNILIVLETCQNTVSLLNHVFIQVNIITQKDSIIFQKKIKEHQQDINAIFSQAKEKYLFELKSIMPSPAIKKTIKKIEHNFDQHFLLLTPKTEKHKLALLNALRAFGIQPITTAGQIKVDLYDCSPTLLAKACEKSLVTLKEEASLAKLKEEQAEAKLKLIQAESTNLAKLPSAQTSAEKEQITIPIQIPSETNKKPAKLIKNVKKVSVEAVTPDNPSQKPDITYHWPETGLTYHSKEGNQGTVKMLTTEDNSIPEDMYFAYIPDYILDDEHYHPGFADRLTRGKIHNQCIRWITKEMQSLQKSECFLFKIVISRRDPRMYLWIEDIYTDEEGKQHFLLCAGLVSNHKLKNLPNNPQKLKDKKMQKYQKTNTAKIISQQISNKDMAQKFFNSFIEIIYDEALAIPEQIKISLQTFLNDFMNSIYGATKELSDEQVRMLFSQLLEMNSILAKINSQNENPNEQLATIQEILQLLSALKKQNIYWYIVNPLWKVMQEFENYYLMEIKKSSATNDTETFIDDEAAEQLLAQLTETSVQTEIAVNNFEKVESTETLQQTSEKENSTSNISTFLKKIV